MGVVFMLYIILGTGFGSGMFPSIPRTVKHCVGGLLSPILACRLVHFALAHPTLKAWALAWICRYPALESWLYRFSRTWGLTKGGTAVQIYSDPSRLTPSTLRIYADLKAAVERHDMES